MSVLSLPLAKDHLNVSGTPTTLGDTELQAIIDSAEAAIAQKCGPLASTATTSRVRGDGVERLVLPVPPVISLTSVTPVGGTALTLGDLMVTAGGVVEYVNGGSFGSRWYDVVYAAGRTACPADLLWAVKELVRHLAETQRGPGRQIGPRQSDAAANTIPGAAYQFPFRVTEAIAPHLQHGFA